MFDRDWVTVSTPSWLMIPLTVLGIYAALLLLTRLAGLRSFSKMSSFDFALTVAIGSVVATTLLSKQPALLAGAWGLTWIYAVQALVSWGRRRNGWVSRLVDNRPLLLMAGSRIVEAHLDRARLTRDDLHSKLRMAGITHRDEIFAVVLETTGDVSVMKRTHAVELELFDAVRGSELLREHPGAATPTGSGSAQRG